MKYSTRCELVDSGLARLAVAAAEVVIAGVPRIVVELEAEAGEGRWVEEESADISAPCLRSLLVSSG